ncbi:hypothetical protein CALCODRAFT_485696 [Calocera cornea HHB12733]|uniref:Mediator of RNA polymerase II transcription subunit 8 n=1 Tax=Calocera cornea HHB12733 TaxID=1353952 RepID=A0A165E7B6_9BASI|nr:hypothetical protein CALCODRAFT_485696 [Calocera cornea HHB12733]
MSSSEDDDDRHSDSSQVNAVRTPATLLPSAAGQPPSLGLQNNPTLQAAALPPLDSINLKFSQIHDGIVSLARSIEADGDRSIAAWPDILAKYNFLVSQSHILSQTLSNSAPAPEDHPADPRTRRPPLSNLPRLVLHPSSAPPEDQSMDFRVAALIRTALIPDMAEHEARVLKAFGELRQSEFNEDVALNHLVGITQDHDGRARRIFEQTIAFREQYDWTARVSVAPPDDAPHSPSINVPAASPMTLPTGSVPAADVEDAEEAGSDIFEEGAGSDPGTGGTNTSDEAFLLEAELEDGGDGAGATPSGAPSVTSETSRI